MQDEIDALAKQIAYLESKLDFLKHRAGIPDQQSVVQQTINNTMLREILRNKQYLVAGLKSNIASDMVRLLTDLAILYSSWTSD